jgi:hypothetical protein
MSDVRTTEEASGHDAQRELEHRALRNVRGLVERIEADEQAKHGSQKWVVAGLVAIVVVIGAIVAITVGRTPGSGQEIVVPPPAKAPFR